MQFATILPCFRGFRGLRGDGSRPNTMPFGPLAAFSDFVGFAKLNLNILILGFFKRPCSLRKTIVDTPDVFPSRKQSSYVVGVSRYFHYEFRVLKYFENFRRSVHNQILLEIHYNPRAQKGKYETPRNPVWICLLRFRNKN